jgi:large subunit ribosomal protein L21
MIKMVATKRFLKQGVMVEEGESFSVQSETLAFEFEARDLAKRVTADENKAYEPTTKEETGETDYNDMTVRELRVLAKEKGIEGYSNMTKAELVAALHAAARGA